jgi:hypothetical protein
VRKTKGRNNVEDVRRDKKIILKTTLKTLHAKTRTIRGKLEENNVLVKNNEKYINQYKGQI